MHYLIKRLCKWTKHRCVWPEQWEGEWREKGDLALVMRLWPQWGPNLPFWGERLEDPGKECSNRNVATAFRRQRRHHAR